MPSILESLSSINIKQRIAVIMMLNGISRFSMSRLVANPAINEWNNIKRDLYRIKNELIKVSLIVIITGFSA